MSTDTSDGTVRTAPAWLLTADDRPGTALTAPTITALAHQLAAACADAADAGESNGANWHLADSSAIGTARRELPSTPIRPDADADGAARTLGYAAFEWCWQRADDRRAMQEWAEAMDCTPLVATLVHRLGAQHTERPPEAILRAPTAAQVTEARQLLRTYVAGDDQAWRCEPETASERRARLAGAHTLGGVRLGHGLSEHELDELAERVHAAATATDGTATWTGGDVTVRITVGAEEK